MYDNQRLPKEVNLRRVRWSVPEEGVYDFSSYRLFEADDFLCLGSVENGVQSDLKIFAHI